MQRRALSVEAAALAEPAQTTQAVVQPWQAPRTRPPPVCSALRCNLKLLHLTTVAVDKPLAVAIRRHVQPAALMLSCVTPTSDAWLPQLQECSVTFYSNDQISQLNHGLEATVLTQLSSLVLRDARTELLPGASPPNLPALPRLPALCKLVRQSRSKPAGAKTQS